MLPLAVLSIAPSEDWSGSFKTMLKNCNKETWVKSEDLDQLLSVANSKLPAAGLVYVTKRGAIPVIYLPVVDYDQFLKLVDQRFGLKRGIVSNFYIGRHEMFVRKVGNYALMGISKDILDYCSKTPDHYLEDLPERFSVALKVRGEAFPTEDKGQLARSIASSFSMPLADLVYRSKTLEVGITGEPGQPFVFNAVFEDVPPSYNVDKLTNDLTETKGLDATAVSKDDSLAVRFELPVAMLTSNLPSVESGVIETLKAQEPLLAVHASSALRELAKSHSSGGGGGNCNLPVGAGSSRKSSSARRS